MAREPPVDDLLYSYARNNTDVCVEKNNKMKFYELNKYFMKVK